MSRSKAIYAVVLVLSLIVAAFGVYRQIDARQDPAAARASADAQRALAPAPLTVSLSALSERRVAALGSSTFLAVNAAGAAISEVRLYDGSALIGVKRLSPARKNRVSVRFEWPAVRVGAHVLHAEATGAEASEVGHSAPLRLRAVPGAVPATEVSIPGNGRTPAELAAATGVAPGSLTYRNSRGRTVAAPPASRPIADGVVVRAPLEEITAAPPQAAPAGEERPSTITATLDGCRATVTPTSDQSVSVYELTGGAAGFTLRGTATSNAPYVSGDLTPGTHVFVAGTGDAPADSDPVSLEAPSTCLAEAWTGDATLFDGELRLPEPEPRVWVYLGVDGKPFQRIPATGSVPASFGTADLSGYMPTVAGSKIRMEVWRPGATPGAAATLVERSESTVGTSVVDLLGGTPNVRLSIRGANGANPFELAKSATTVTFDWSTPSQIPDGVVWQVLGRPLSSTDRNTTPPVLLATGYAQDGAGGGVKIAADKAGSFEVPAELLLAGRPASGPVEDVLSQVPTPSVAELVSPGSSFGVTPLTAPKAGQIPTLDAGVVPIPIGDIYVRVLPMTGTSVVGDASNTVAVALPPLDPASAAFTATQVTFDPGRAANYELSNCVRITGTPANGQNLISIYSADRTWCQSDFDTFKGGGCNGWCGVVADLGSFVSFVGKVWDYIATAYNTIVDTLVTLIAKFNPYCLTASVTAALSESPYADAASKGCEAIATVVGSVVVSVVLSSFGLPARLPTSKQLAEVVEGDLTGLAVAYLDSLGVPCKQMTVDASTVSAIDAAGVEVPPEVKKPNGEVDVCAAMIKQAVNAIREEIKEAAQAEVANTTGLPVPPAPQQMELEPRGQYQGAQVVVEAKPIDPNTPKTARCAVAAIGDVRDWKVGNYGALEPRDIEQGHGSVRYRPQSALGFGAPWAATLRMAPIQDLVDSETISVSVTSSCFSPNQIRTFRDVPLRAPLGLWFAGQAE